MSAIKPVPYLKFGGQLGSEARRRVVAEYHPDTLGSVAATVNSSGVATSTFDYTPYVEPVNQTGSNPSGCALVLAERHFATCIGLAGYCACLNSGCAGASSEV